MNLKYQPTQLCLWAGFSSPTQASFFLICTGYHLHVMPRPVYFLVSCCYYLILVLLGLPQFISRLSLSNLSFTQLNSVDVSFSSESLCNPWFNSVYFSVNSWHEFWTSYLQFCVGKISPCSFAFGQAFHYPPKLPFSWFVQLVGGTTSFFVHMWSRVGILHLGISLIHSDTTYVE